jgi:EAL domain-containing protein (putative c-di-GMP-specific phosphodiesterase class I)
MMKLVKGPHSEALSSACFDDRFELYYQLQNDLRSGAGVGYEALLRSVKAGTDIVQNKVIARAERDGSIHPLGLWILSQAVAFHRQVAPLLNNSARISVNVSPLQLTSPSFAEDVLGIMSEHQVNGSALTLEITEQSRISNIQMAIEHIQSLRAYGVKVVLDDFGSGCTSLSDLAVLPVDGIKIDRSFTNKLYSTKHSAILKALLTLANELSLSVVAEGIETQDERLFYSLFPGVVGQGYLFHRPVSEREFKMQLACFDRGSRPLFEVG